MSLYDDLIKSNDEFLLHITDSANRKKFKYNLSMLLEFMSLVKTKDKEIICKIMKIDKIDLEEACMSLSAALLNKTVDEGVDK